MTTDRSHRGTEPASIRQIAVLGAGTMGSGIALVAAIAEREVSLFDIDAASLDSAIERIEDRLGRLHAQGRLAGVAPAAVQSRIRKDSDLRGAVRGAELVIEAIPEHLETKRVLFREIDRMASPGAILATNTSSIRIAQIAEATAHPERVIGLHFFNPVWRMKLVEIVCTDCVAPDVVRAMQQFADALNKESIVVRDAPGFATSRLGVALGCEAIRLLEQGIASAADIDRAMELGYGHPMGPLRLTDLIGLDVRLAIMEQLHAELGAMFRPPELLRRMVEEGKLGRKSGEGFYRYDS